MAKHAFEKFMNSEPTGAKKKEMVKVEKRKAKKEAKAIGDLKRQEKWEKLHGVIKENTTPNSLKKGESKFDKKNLSNNTSLENNLSPKEKNKKFSPNKKASNNYVRSNSDKYFKQDANASIKDNDTTVATEMPLNKFIAYSGVCGRREAAELVKQGLVTVNGDIVYEPGYKVLAKDEIQLKGKRLFIQKNLVYILLNKPKDYITTSADPNGRKTVLDLLKDATTERVYPVGRLDRNTTGVLLLTNDGELAQKLTHPSYHIKKVYAVKLDKPITKKDFDAIIAGVTLEDGFIQPDMLAYSDVKDKTQLGIEIHSGKNRIVRRIFEHLGYEVKNLDRVMFANLTKKNVERGNWRFLNQHEIRSLKYLNQSFTKKPPTADVSFISD
ncbi:MAG: pseudouridine synthase [Chitinophagaceae bacterium]